MRLRDALALGALQGLSEFLPVSSSAHLSLARAVLGHGALPRAFDVGLHLGTTAALLVMTAPEWRRLVGEVTASARSRGRQRAEGVHRPGTVLPVLVGSAPAIVVGAALHRPIEAAGEEPRIVSLGLVAGTVAMAALSLRGRQTAPSAAPAPISNRQAWKIGGAQAAALVPGLSRSGMTLSAGVALGLEREAALRFSLLLAVPVTLAAAGRTARDFPQLRGAVGGRAMAAGVATSFATGLVGLVLLRRLVRRFGVWPFLPYRLALAAVVWWRGWGRC